MVLAADIDVDAWDSSDFGGGSSGAAGFGAAADTASVSDGEAADPIDVDATEVDPLDTEYDEYDGGDDDDDDDAGGMDEDDLARPHDQWQMGLDEAGAHNLLSAPPPPPSHPASHPHPLCPTSTRQMLRKMRRRSLSASAHPQPAAWSGADERCNCRFYKSRKHDVL